MIICDNCQKEVPKLTFCCTKCRVYYHRTSVKTPKTKVESPVKKVIKTPEDIPANEGMCKHGAAYGLCKYGCTK